MLEKGNPKRSGSLRLIHAKKKKKKCKTLIHWALEDKKTLPDRSLFLCEQNKHKLLFTTTAAPSIFPPQHSTCPSGGLVAVYPKSIFKKEINKHFHSSFAPLDFFGGNKMRLRSAQVSLAAKKIHLLTFPWRSPHTEPRCDPAFSSLFQPGSIFFFLQGVSDLIPRWAHRSRTSSTCSSGGFLWIDRTLTVPSN